MKSSPANAGLHGRISDSESSGEYIAIVAAIVAAITTRDPEASH